MTRINWWEVSRYSFLYFLFAVIGIFIGMTYQQMIIEKQVIDILSNTNLEINVNMNETKMVDYTMRRFNETILPQLRILGNKT